MLDFYFSATPNGLKVRLYLEEAALAYRVVPVRLSNGEQFSPAFTKISPNNKIPALVDHQPADGGPSLALFESGAILLYLAEKTGHLMPGSPRGRIEAIKWMFWQVGGLGPIGGQAGHFWAHAPEHIPHAVNRYTKEMGRLYGVLDRRLLDRGYIAEEYSIADIAAYPWVVPHASFGHDLKAFPNLARWFERISERPATIRVYEGVEDVYAPSTEPLGEDARKILFGSSQQLETCP